MKKQEEKQNVQHLPWIDISESREERDENLWEIVFFLRTVRRSSHAMQHGIEIDTYMHL